MPTFRQAGLDSFVPFLFTCAMDIQISIPGASTADISRGLAAASAVFRSNATDAVEVALARFAVDGWDIQSFPAEWQPPARMLDIHMLWFKADSAAVEACCVGWDPLRIPTTANLELTDGALSSLRVAKEA